MIGILPTLSAGHMSPASLTPNPRYQLLSDQILAARGEDIVIDIGGPERLRTTVGLDRPRGGLHQHPAAHPGQPRGLPGLLERLPGHRRRAARARRQLAVPARPRAVARDAGAAVRAGHRHPQRGAQGAGRPAPGVVRRAVDQLDLRPVRGERPLLPGAAAGDRRGGPARRARVGPHPVAGRAAAAQRHDLPLEPAGLRRRRRHARTCGSRTACCPPGRRSRTRWPTRRSTSGWCGPWPSTSGRCGRRCRSAPPRRTSTSRPSRASTPRSTGRASVRCPPPSSSYAGCCRWRGPVSTRGACSSEESDRLLGIIEQRCIVGQNGASWFAGRFATRRRRQRRRPARRAAQHAQRVPRAHAHQRARAHLGVASQPQPLPAPGLVGQHVAPPRPGEREERRPGRGRASPNAADRRREPLQVQVVRLRGAGTHQPRRAPRRRGVLEQRARPRRCAAPRRGPGRSWARTTNASRGPAEHPDVHPQRRRPGGSRRRRNRPTSWRSSSRRVGATVGSGSGHGDQHAASRPPGRGRPQARRGGAAITSP